MGNRKQPYKMGWPKKYFDGIPNSGSDASWKESMDTRKEAYEAGEKIDFDDVLEDGGKIKAKPISDTVKKTLKNKSKESGISYGTLAKVYRRGQGAWMSGGSRKGVGMAGWAMGRVNSFIKGSKKHDTDLR
jgi:hypothetical protein